MNNLNIFADATLNGGIYGNIRVFGSASITGDLEADNISVFGSSDFSGSCKINDLKILGSCDFNSKVNIKNLDIKGSSSFNDDVNAEFIKIYGSVHFNKHIYRAKELSIYGEVNANTLEADKITIKGYVHCSEQLNGDKIEISSHSGSQIKEMVGSIIKVKPENKLFNHSFEPVVCEIVEGDDIYLENVVASTVRGKKIIIGPRCKIELVEYQDTCEVNNNSDVKKVTKM